MHFNKDLLALERRQFIIALSREQERGYKNESKEYIKEYKKLSGTKVNYEFNVTGMLRSNIRSQRLHFLPG
jgi:hypothetical protein